LSIRMAACFLFSISLRQAHDVRRDATAQVTSAFSVR
jgi:hypothetical protein